MTHVTVDLYSELGLVRGTATGGFLTTYVPNVHPELKPKLRPAMLVLPGGAYANCSKRESEPVAIRFMYEGFAAFVLEYSVMRMHPTPLAEACMAVSYLRKNADKFGIDSNRIAAVGFSAGGHLVSCLGTLYGENAIVERLGDYATLARPDAIVVSYPVITLEDGLTHKETKRIITGGKKELVDVLSVEKRVGAHSVPTFIWHTAEDDLVPVENSMLLAQAYRKHNVPFALHIFEQGWHGLSVCNRETSDCTESDKALFFISAWIDLALDWLRYRGFDVKIQD